MKNFENRANKILAGFKWMSTQYMNNTYPLKSHVVQEAIPTESLL